MKIFRYKLPLSEPVSVRQSTHTHREGLFMTSDYMPFSVYGEAAPLPGFSKETIDDIDALVKEKFEVIDRYFMQDNGYDNWNAFAASLNLSPSLRFGLDTFLFDRLSKYEKLPLSQYLSKSSPSCVRVNALIRETKPDKIKKEALAYWHKGFRTLKLKVSDDFDETLRVLKDLRSILPDANLRIDANQSWDVDQAINNLLVLESINIEYCEQPVKVADMLMQNEICMKCAIPVAADEAARSVKEIEILIENNAADLLVIKPMLIGSFDELFRIAEIAKAHGIELVFTTSFESGIGRTATAHLAAALGSTRFAHGLATGGLLGEDFINDDDFIRDGHFYFTEAAGLGIKPKLEGLELVQL